MSRNTLDENRNEFDDTGKAYVNPTFVPELVLNKSETNSVVKQRNVSNKEETPAAIDFDDLLPHIGEFGRYQKILFLLMIPFAFFVAFVYFAQIFITIVPEEHWCRVPELTSLTSEAR